MRKLTLFSIIVFILFICPKADADMSAVSASVRAQYNEDVGRIYSRFWQLKEQYPELEKISRGAINRDENGFDTISYAYDLQGEYAYRFSLKIQDISDDTFYEEYDAWLLKFPLLGFEVVVESRSMGSSSTFDPRQIITEGFEELKAAEQSYLPFKLELKLDKDVYRVKEQIVLTVSLKNTVSQAFKVADLNEQSLYCEIDDKEWGTKDSAGELDVVLKPYGSLSKILKIESIKVPKEAWVACTYGLGFKGVKPYNRIKISIHP